MKPLTRKELCAAVAAKLGFRSSAAQAMCASVLYFSPNLSMQALQRAVDYVPGPRGTDPESFLLVLEERLCRPARGWRGWWRQFWCQHEWQYGRPYRAIYWRDGWCRSARCPKCDKRTSVSVRPDQRPESSA
jgi:hypothetical protein